MRKNSSLIAVALMLSTIFQPLSILPVKAQPFSSPGTRYGMNVESSGYYSSDSAFVDLMHSSSWTVNGSKDAMGYPTATSGGYCYFCVIGDTPGLQTYNFYGEGIFTPGFGGSYSTNQNWPYGGYTGPWQSIVGMRGAVQSSVSVLPPNYPGNPSSQYIIVPANSAGNPNATPPVPANPLAITLIIPPNSPPNPVNKVVTTCQVQIQVPPASSNAYVYDPTYGGGGVPISQFTINNVNPQGTSGENPGNCHLTRPGYPAWQSTDSDYPVTSTSYPLFTNEYLRSFAPFCALRFMDWMNTNNNTGLTWGANGIVNNGTYSWNQRLKQGVLGDAACYEYMCALCNATGCDMWANVPLQATDDWKVGFATLLKNNLNPWLHVYYEHGNELWNWGFIAWQIVDQWAVADFGSDGKGAWFDHGEEMGKLLMSDVTVMQPIFKGVGADFGRPILAGQFVLPTSYCGGGLTYIQNNYGPPKNYIYGMAGAPYFSLDSTEFAGSDLTNMQANMKLANQYGIKMCGYEGGQGLGGPTGAGDTIDEANQQTTAMSNQYYLFAQMWQQNGGDLCNWFTNTGLDGNYGCWGHLPVASLINNLNDPACTKYRAAAAIAALCNCGNAAPAAPPPPSGSTGSSGSSNNSTSNGGSNGSTTSTGSNNSTTGSNSSTSNSSSNTSTMSPTMRLRQWSPGGLPTSE